MRVSDHNYGYGDRVARHAISYRSVVTTTRPHLTEVGLAYRSPMPVVGKKGNGYRSRPRRPNLYQFSTPHRRTLILILTRAVEGEADFTIHLGTEAVVFRPNIGHDQ